MFVKINKQSDLRKSGGGSQYYFDNVVLKISLERWCLSWHFKQEESDHVKILETLIQIKENKRTSAQVLNGKGLHMLRESKDQLQS